tara:strand:+ start:308 stop:664 length:357 start_codon:yes stop_codon:yes gene_type:complete
MKIGNIYVSEGKHLKAEDLQGNVRRLTIESYHTVSFDGQEGEKVVLQFVGAKKGLVLNQTNAHRIAENFSTDEVDEWIGKTVAIYPTSTDFAGKRVHCIRVKEEIPAPTTGDTSEIPF